MVDSVTLITPTHDRPDAFRLCERWMGRQLYDGCLQWIVIDDGETPVTCTMGQKHIRRPFECVPVESFRNNYLTGIPFIEHDVVLFIEDDDWYASNYIDKMVSLIKDRQIAGQAQAKYYNIRYRKYRIHKHSTRHASLCQTAIRSSCIPKVIRYLKTDEKPHTLDTAIWRRVGIMDKHKRLEPTSDVVVGIKGFGSHGVGIHHTQSELVKYHDDPEGERLRQWVGNRDAETYLGMSFT